MRVFLTGATGYVGQAILQTLLAQKLEAVCLVRPGSERKLATFPPDAGRLVIRQGDVLDPASVESAMAGCDAVIHLVGIIREFPRLGITFPRLHVQATKHVVQAARRLGIKRYLHMSALGARIGSRSGYSHSKGIAEQIVQNSELDWTIFRPSVIFGPRDQFVNMLAELIRKAPVVPVIGSGDYRLQPVALENVAAGFVQALAMPETIGRIYEVGGPESYRFNDMIDEIAAAIGTRKAKWHLPVALMQPVVRALERFPFFPITRAQLIMLLEGNTCDPAAYYETFSIRPIPFPAGIRQYVR